MDQLLTTAAWVAQGPAPANNGQTENVTPNNQVVGAVHTVLADPTDANRLWVGAVNGGIWRTTNATDTSPTWTALTDKFRGLSIGAMAFDPTDTDPEADGPTIIAGIGRFSSYDSRGGPLTGLLLSTDGGTTFTEISPTLLQGRNISGVEKRGNTLLVSANNFGDGTGGGVYRSTDNGATWNFISGSNGLNFGAAFDLVGDPTDDQRFYVSVESVGIFRSEDSGANWELITSGDDALNNAITTAGNNNLEMSVSPVNGRLYIGVLRNGQPVYIGFSDNQGANWDQMDLPVTQERNNEFEGLNPRVKPGGQGAIHFSILADPNNQNIVYVGGDRQDRPFPNAIGSTTFSGRLFRGDTTQTATNPGSTTSPNSPQWQPLTHSQGGFSGGGTANNSSPHADSREMTFDANGNLIEVDDGGVYRRTNPQDATGDWFSINGNLQVTEQHDIFYDTISNIIISGNQDTGTTQQLNSGSLTWNSVSQADGGDVAVSVDPNNANQSVRYSSEQDLGGFTRRVYDSNNNLISTTGIGLIGFNSGDAQFNTPIAVNQVDLNRIVIGGGRVYESFDQGDNVSVVNTAGGGSIGVNAFDGDPIVYGGRRNGVDNPDVLYVGSGSNVFVRTTAGGNLVNTNYTGDFVEGLVLAPDDWQTAVAIDSDQVFQTTDANNWQDITGNLVRNFAAGFDLDLGTVEYIDRDTLDAILVGTNRGVFASLSNDFTNWFQFGTGLPNVPIWDFDYDPADDLLVAGTLGRGTWTFSNVSTLLPDNIINGTSNNDFLVGTSRNDIINAGNSQDELQGRDGNDILNAGDGDDRLLGGNGNDILHGGSGQDRLFGEAGDDTQDGGDGDDLLEGGSGNDRLKGGQGQDQLLGNSGDDLLDGGTGDNTLTGGGGSDLFILSLQGKNTILDFQDGQDQLGLSGGLNFAALTIFEQGGTTWITTKNNQPIAFLRDTSASLITSADFTVV